MSAFSAGLIRLGPALAVTETSGLVPGLGIKFMRSGVKSGNFVALVKLDPLVQRRPVFSVFVLCA